MLDTKTKSDPDGRVALLYCRFEFVWYVHLRYLSWPWLMESLSDGVCLGLTPWYLLSLSGSLVNTGFVVYSLITSTLDVFSGAILIFRIVRWESQMNRNQSGVRAIILIKHLTNKHLLFVLIKSFYSNKYLFPLAKTNIYLNVGGYWTALQKDKILLKSFAT